jgi:outer membrane protein assembly factor BamB
MSVLEGTGNILLAFHDRVTQIDPATGRPVELRDSNGQVRVDDSGNPLIWDVRLQVNPATQFYSTPIMGGDDTLIIPTYSRRFYEVDVRAARILNPEGRLIEDESPTNHIVTDVITNENAYFVPMSERGVKAISRSDFSELWAFTTEFGIWAYPLLVENTLYVPSLDHNLYALDAETGEQLWVLDLGGAVSSTPVLHNDYLYVGSFGNKLFKINLDGRIAAEFTTQDWVWGSPAVLDDMLYVGDSRGFVYALNIEGAGFQEVWSRQVASRTIRATPLVSGDTLVVASRDRRAYWLSRETGSEIFNRELGGEVLGDMLLIEPSETINIPEPYLLITTMANQELLVAFSLDNGERRWVYSR